MGLERLFRRPVAEPERRSMYYNLPGGMGGFTQAAYDAYGIQPALRNAASVACIDVLSDAIGRTPFDALRGGTGNRSQVNPQPVILTRPSGIVLRDVWRYQLGFSMTTDGNAFGRIVSMSSAGYPTQIELLDPATVTERKVVNGVPQVKVDTRVEMLYPNGPIWHVPGRIVPAGSPFALSPIDLAGKSIGTSLSAEDFSLRFFTEGGMPSAVITANQELNATQAGQVKDAWRRATSGNREPAVISEGWKVEPIVTDGGATTSYIDLMRFEVEQVCRFWRVPPTMVYGAVSGESVTYANVTQNDLAYLKNSLDGYLVRVEESLTDILPRPQYVKANRNAVLRSDPMSRYQLYALAISNRLMKPNEARELEDQPPLDDGTGDQFFGPMAAGKAEPEDPAVDPTTPTPAAPASPA